MKINKDAGALHELFGFDTASALLEKASDGTDKKFGSIVAIVAKMQRLDSSSTILTMLVVNTITGLKLETLGDFVEYLFSALSEEEAIMLGARVIKIPEDGLHEILKEMLNV